MITLRDSSARIVCDGELLFAVAEARCPLSLARHSRVSGIYGWPRGSVGRRLLWLADAGAPLSRDQGANEI